MFFPPGPRLFSIMFTLVFVLIIGMIVFRIVGGIARWQSNNRKPVLTVPATVVTKRSRVHRNTTNNNGNMMTSSSTTYFVTFQFESGDRIELRVRDYEYGLLAEGDVGQLTFQGTRFLEFTRN